MVDVAIVGSGYTGLSAALPLLRAGRSVLILDSDDPGFGASRRNAGYIGRTLKKTFPELLKKRGLNYATAVYRELDEALQTVRAVIADESIDCFLKTPGRFIGATSPAHYEAMARDYEITKRHLGFDFEMVPRAEQAREIATPIYYGGTVIPDLGSLHPGLYHKGLLERVMAAGGIVRGRSPVTAVSHDGKRAKLTTAGGQISAREVIIATNGYTPRHFRWLARRTIPFISYMAATEILPDEVFRRQIPLGRTVIDSNTNIDFVRPAPDSNRLLFGGSTGIPMKDEEQIGLTLHRILSRILPEMETVRISRIWSGYCAGTFDLMPHVGRQNNIWYGFGYNFAGIPMGTYFGKKIAAKIMGRPDGKTVFEESAVPTLPFYRGNPWFLPYVMKYFDWEDKRFGSASVKESNSPKRQIS